MGAVSGKRCDSQQLITPSVLHPASTHHEYILPRWVYTRVPGYTSTLEHSANANAPKVPSKQAMSEWQWKLAVVVKIVRFPRKRAIPAVALLGWGVLLS